MDEVIKSMILEGAYEKNTSEVIFENNANVATCLHCGSELDNPEDEYCSKECGGTQLAFEDYLEERNSEKN